MSRQAIQDSVDVSVDAVADLSTLINDVRVANGTRVWVSGAGATHGLWCLDQTSTFAVDNLTVVATLSGVGRWIFFGASGGAAAGANISVNTEALLSAVGVSALKDGAIAWVGNPLGGVGQSQDSLWTLVTQIGVLPALSPHEVIASAAAGRVWQRLLDVITPRWTQQITWFIDPVAGDDQSDGSSAPNALASWAEFARRMPVAATAYTVNILNNLSATDPISWAPKLEWSRQLSANKPAITIVGIETATASGVFAAGATKYAGNTASQFTVAAHGAWAVGTAVRITSGASVNAITIVSRDMGGGQAECSPYWNSATSAEANAPALNDTFNEVSWTTAPDLRIPSLTVTVQKMSFTAITGVRGSAYLFQDSRAPGFGLLLGEQVQWSGCHINNGNLSALSYALHVALGSFIDRTATTLAMNFNSGGNLSIASTLIRGNAVGTTAGIQVGGNIGGPGLLVVRTSQIFALGTAATSAIKAVVAGFVDIESSLGGSGNASVGGAAFEVFGGQVYVKTGVTPTITSAGVELFVDGAANQIPPLVAGAATPLAAAITTWAQWAAAPFGRFFQGNGTGTVISSTP